MQEIELLKQEVQVESLKLNDVQQRNANHYQDDNTGLSLQVKPKDVKKSRQISQLNKGYMSKSIDLVSPGASNKTTANYLAVK